MILDLEHDLIPRAFSSADICIVGAGAAGIVLAAELVRQGKRVLLLESGGAAAEPAAQELNRCSYTGQAHRSANIGRFRALGGTTTVWGGQVLELGSEDFKTRSWVPGSGWPIPKEELQTHYERAVLSEGLSQGIGNDPEVWRQIHTAAPDLGKNFEFYFTRWCREPNFARFYRTTFDSANLCVVLHATAARMVLAENGIRVDGIQCRTPTGKEHTFIAAQYILCLGTIESVRFLLQPLPGGQTAPWNRSGLLGRHFQSHIDMNAAHIPADDAAGLRRWFSNVYLRGYKYHPKIRLAFPLQQRDQTLSIAGSITCIHPEETELRRVKSLIVRFRRNPADARATLSDLPRILRRLTTIFKLTYSFRVQHRAAWPRNSTFWLRTHCEQEPLSQSRITLTEERDAAGLFGACLDWRVSPLEWKTIRCFTERVRDAFATRNLARIVPVPELAREDGFRDIVFDDSHHHMGGARIAASSSEGVVDPDLRLHGVENAYLCSGAVFPTSGFSNPTHTLIALAIRLADHLGRAPHPSQPSHEERDPALENKSRA